MDVDTKRSGASGAHTRSWRVSTAARAFALALGVGQVLTLESPGSMLLPLLILAVVATVACSLEIRETRLGTPWIPVVEALVVTALLTTGGQPAEPLLVYLAVPPVVAGVRHGWVTTVNTGLAGVGTFLAAWLAIAETTTRTEAVAALLWLALGLGAGLLASWQSRSVRRLEATQAPFAAAHHLVSQLHTLTQRGQVGLDSQSVAAAMADSLRVRSGADRSVVLVRSDSGALTPLSHHGAQADLLEFAEVPGRARQGAASADLARFPLRVGDHVFGVLVLGRVEGWTRDLLGEVRQSLDAQAVRLETALLFDSVRLMATSEERSRLAREMHDGVAQEIVALGYLVDEIESGSSDPATLATTEALRDEITRVVGEIRFSIFDLRHEVTDQHLSGALAEYVRELSAGSDLRVHLVFDEQGPPLPRRTEAELLRVAQEAIANVRKHARADNLWVTLATDGTAVRLEVADDGIGSARPRDRHYGLHTMRERAQQIGATLDVSDRSGGGTVVSLRTTTTASIGDRLTHDDPSPAGR